MARRVTSAISKFRAVELELRTAANAVRAAIEEIDEALAKKRRTQDELALLRAIRAQAARLHQDAINVVGRLYDEVERGAE